MGVADDNAAGTPAGPDDRPMTPLETAKALSFAKLRIAELEKALRDLLAHDDARFGWEGEPSDVEKRCRAVLENRQAKLI